VLNALARFVEHIFELQGYDVEGGNEALAVDRGQCGEEQILNIAGGGRFTGVRMDRLAIMTSSRRVWLLLRGCRGQALP